MAISRKPRHWIPLPLTIVWTVLAIVQFADFSGEPTPRWREISLLVLAPICLGFLLLNMILDGRAPRDS